ncbi:MAG: sulfite exporter TauE/SafE family protein [Lentisphaerae bacterium]|nr:sulfite exporter TauE/SafE family protein [Lentisphaerota bacterium]
MLDIAVCLVAGAVLGFLVGLAGVGGGVLTVPILILVMGMEPITAVGTAGLFAILTRTHAVIKHGRQGTINLRIGSRLLVAAVPGIIVTSLLVNWGKASLRPEGVAILQNSIGYIVIGSILVSLCALLVDYRRFDGSFFRSGHGKVIGVFLTFLVGAVMGATSVGGGILLIPALLLVYRETSKYVGTSLFVGVLLLLVMSVIYAFVGGDGHFSDVDLRIAGLMAVGSLLGTHYGSSLSRKIDPRRLQFVVVGVVILAVVMMCVDKLR